MITRVIGTFVIESVFNEIDRYFYVWRSPKGVGAHYITDMDEESIKKIYESEMKLPNNRLCRHVLMYFNLDSIEPLIGSKKPELLLLRETSDSRRVYVGKVRSIVTSKWKIIALTTSADTAIDLYDYLATTGIRNTVDADISDNEGPILEFEVPYEVKFDTLSFSVSRNLPVGYRSTIEFIVEARYPMLWIPINKDGLISYDEQAPYILNITANFYDQSTGKLISTIQIA